MQPPCAWANPALGSMSTCDASSAPAAATHCAPLAATQLLLLLLQVSAFGSDTQTDGGDNWVLEWDTKGKFWRQNTKVSRAPTGCGHSWELHASRTRPLPPPPLGSSRRPV